MNTYDACIKPLSYWFGRQMIRLPHWLTIVGTVALVFGLVYQMEKLVINATPREATKQPEGQLARMNDEISVHAAGQGNPWINLSDGHELITPYSGPMELTQILEQNEARPLSLCSADFDEDGVPDLISGYAGPKGGIVALLRGNVDSIYPNAAEAKHRETEGTFTDAPFLSPAFVVGVPEAADFIGAGDFDGDSHWDVLAAKRGRNRLYLLSGDGKGGLALSRTIALQGTISALVVGEINRRDGLNDIVVGIDGEAGAKALVFEGPEGAFKANPEEFTLPTAATSLALGRLDDEHEYDLAIAAGKELMIISGRDRKLSLDAERQATVPAAEVNTQAFAFEIHAIAIGDFKEGSEQEIALLCDDGKIRVLSREGQCITRLASARQEGQIAMPSHIDTPDLNRQTTIRIENGAQNPAAREFAEPRKQESRWRAEVLREGVWSSEARLVNVRTSSIPLDNVLVMDRASRQLDFAVAKMSDEALRATIEQGVREYPTATLEAQMEMGAGATAVLPMRLNSDALSDLVIMKSNLSALTVAATQPQSIFTVTNTNDSGPGSFRQAIIDAGANSGADTITFNVPGGVPQSIKLVTPLPASSGSVTIDATTQPGFAGKPVIELNGKDVVDSGFEIARGLAVGTNSVVRGLVINRFFHWGISGGVINNVIEGNFIGTDVTGTIGRGNEVGILNGRGNLFGGTTVAARNIISGNGGDGIQIGNASSTENLIQGNYIGTDVTGSVALPNHDDGVDITEFAPNNLIGGTVAGAGNVISGNSGNSSNGVQITAPENLVQGNYIGLDRNGSGGVANKGTGVSISSTFDPTGVRPVNPGRDNTIGGTTKAARNVISGNTSRGVVIISDVAKGNLVQGNFIGTDATGTSSVGNSAEGILVSVAPESAIGGATAGSGNLISGNSGFGIGLGLLFLDQIGGTGTVVEGNYVGTDVTGAKPLGNGKDGIFVNVDSKIHTVRNNSIAFNNGNGVNIPNITANPGTPGFRISIFSNAIFSNSAMGINLGDAGVTLNDKGDADAGANELQNFPVLTSSAGSTASLPTNRTTSALASATITGTFNSTPNTTFTLQFFFGSNCQGAGHQFTGLIPIALDPTIQIVTDANGTAGFTYAFQFPSGSAGTGFVNATATNSTGNTSELSECIAVANPDQVGAIVTGACKGVGKQLIISGSGFVDGAKVFLNGEAEKTQFVSATEVIAFKAGKRAQTGDTLKVRNPDSTETTQITYTRVNCSP
jgi:VCBS repeat protein